MEFLAQLLKSPGLFNNCARSDRTHPYVNIPTRNELYLVWNIYKLHIYMIFRIWILVFVWDISFHVVIIYLLYNKNSVHTQNSVCIKNTITKHFKFCMLYFYLGINLILKTMWNVSWILIMIPQILWNLK